MMSISELRLSRQPFPRHREWFQMEGRERVTGVFADMELITMVYKAELSMDKLSVSDQKRDDKQRVYLVFGCADQTRVPWRKVLDLGHTKAIIPSYCTCLASAY